MKLFKNETTRFLSLSLAFIILACTCIFFFLAFHMSSQSTLTINEVGGFYMSSMSQQISRHFETIITLRLDQVEALVSTVVENPIHEDADAQERLCTYAQALELDYLGFYNTRNEFEMLYGSPLTVTNPAPFTVSLFNGEKKVSVGKDAEGNDVILLGVPATHEPTPEHSCVGLVAALPVEYIRNTLDMEENLDHFYSFIVRRDGSFVVHSSDASHGSYFDRVLALYEDVGGKTPEKYLEELSYAMDHNEDYSSEFTIYGERRRLYCTHLANSEWFLLTFMPYSTMDNMVRGLNMQWIMMALIGAGALLLVFNILFALYFRLSHRQLRALEQARREAEAAAKAKSEFLSNMSHDIRTPMNAIVGVTAIATANIDDKEQVQSCLKKITLSSKHLLGLINDVLDMSKIESGRMTLCIEMVSLREVMDSIIGIVQPQIHSKKQRFSVSIHDISAENVYCDSVRLNQVLLNFLSNAIKFTPEGGSISIALYEEESPRGEDYVRTHIRVKDTGIGMTPEFQARIFESFTREDSARVHKTEGTGLGMAIAKYIVDAMGGTIEVESAPGQGSEFHVTLDLEKADKTEAEMILPNWNMLVVDDDKQLCESAAASLQSIGVRADWTLDGESAIAMAEQRRQARDDYHIILLDWKLPGIDGIETARRIRRRLGEDVPILLISAYDWSEIEAEAREAGVTGFISKPLFKSTLYHGLKPFAEGGADLPSAEAAEPYASLTGRRVLLAEDNDLNWEIANELLTAELGLELDRAENGQICLAKFEHAPAGYYDAILMDIRMPVMTGYQATEAIRALDREEARTIPIIAMTADAFAEDVKKCLDCGMNAHIAKPIDIREVARLLEKFIDA